MSTCLAHCNFNLKHCKEALLRVSLIYVIKPFETQLDMNKNLVLSSSGAMHKVGKLMYPIPEPSVSLLRVCGPCDVLSVNFSHLNQRSHAKPGCFS